MAKTTRRSRNSARKAKSRPHGFVSQTSEPHRNLAPNPAPGAGFHGPEAGDGFVPQSATIDVPSTNRASTNRANAANSTGPRTAEGKAASSRNAFIHGLSRQRHAVLPDENPAAYDQLVAELREIYEPRSRREDLAVEDIAQCRWAIQRCDEAEATRLAHIVAGLNHPDIAPEGDILTPGQALGYASFVDLDTDARDRRFVLPNTDYPALDKIHRYRTWWDRRLQRALAELDRATRSRHAEARHQRQQDDDARKTEHHQLRLAEAQAKAGQAREKLAREQAKTTGQQAKAANRKAKSEEDSLFKALERVLSATPNGFRHWPGINPNHHANPEPAHGFVPQNPIATEETARPAHSE